MQISTIGIDIGKSCFHVVGFDARGAIVLRQRCSRTQVMRALANLPPCLVGMEACCGAHHLGRMLVKQGHDVRLMPPQYVRPFVKSNKNDLLDAEAIGEAVQRPTMRFVPLKTVDQLDLQALHRVRTRLVARRTGVINQLRGLLLERGVTFPVGRRALVEGFPTLLDNPAVDLSPASVSCSCSCGTNGAGWTTRSTRPITRSRASRRTTSCAVVSRRCPGSAR